MWSWIACVGSDPYQLLALCLKLFGFSILNSTWRILVELYNLSKVPESQKEFRFFSCYYADVHSSTNNPLYFLLSSNILHMWEILYYLARS